MIARQDMMTERADVWAKLSAPLPQGVIAWRQDGRPVARDGKHFARFVCYIEANTVRERLDTVVPGEWDLTLELLPQLEGVEDSDATVAFKARLQILGVIREDVGTGRDYKQASTDAFKRAAVRFGIGHELYAYEQNWVEVDGDGKYAKPVEDPQGAYVRRYGSAQPGGAARAAARITESAGAVATGSAAATTMLTDLDAVSCPKCGGRMWDNRLTKRNPKAPDFKCRDRNCDGVVWPPRNAGEAQRPADASHDAHDGGAAPVAAAAATRKREHASVVETDEIPF